RTANHRWKEFSSGIEVVVETDFPNSSLAEELALPRNSINKRQGNQISGMGAFAVAHWDPGKKLTVTANTDYWNGRPFVDSIEIDLGKNLREQAISLDLHKADVIETAPV